VIGFLHLSLKAKVALPSSPYDPGPGVASVSLSSTMAGSRLVSRTSCGVNQEIFFTSWSINFHPAINEIIKKTRFGHQLGLGVPSLLNGLTEHGRLFDESFGSEN
jgi:hypothetical protein